MKSDFHGPQGMDSNDSFAPFLSPTAVVFI